MDTGDTSPCVLLFFDQRRFIFNAGEVGEPWIHDFACIGVSNVALSYCCPRGVNLYAMCSIICDFYGPFSQV